MQLMAEEEHCSPRSAECEELEPSLLLVSCGPTAAPEPALPSKFNMQLNCGTTPLRLCHTWHCPRSEALHGPSDRMRLFSCQWQIQFNAARAERRRQARGRSRTVCAAAAAAASPVHGVAWSQLGSMLLGAGVFLLGLAAVILLFAAVPLLLSMRRTALAMELLLHTVEREIPDTAATVRLSGLEMADAIQEVSLLGNDLTRGVRASARAVTEADAQLRQGAQLARAAVVNGAIPAVRSRAPGARDAVEGKLKERAALQYSPELVRQVAQSTKVQAAKARLGLGLTGMLSNALSYAAAVQTGQEQASSQTS